MSDTASLADSYSLTATAWRDGPGRIYNHLATELVQGLPCITGALALDLGAGTGAASTALHHAGARVIACDLAMGMLAVDRARRPPAVVADALALPFSDDTFDVVVAAFSLNHIVRPDRGLREAARVTRPGGCVLASAYADDDAHPVKVAADSAARDMGWEPPTWRQSLASEAMPQLATVERARAQVRAAGLAAAVDKRMVSFPTLDIDDLIEWRLGMAHLAPFVTALSTPRRAELVRRVRATLGDHAQQLVRRIIVITVSV